MVFRAHIEDAEMLHGVAPASLREYLVSQGWRRIEAFGDHSDVYANEDGVEVILPGTTSLADYARAVSDVIARLARTEGRDELQIFRDVSTSGHDVIRVRAPEAEVDGSVSIDSGVDLVVHARDLLLSAACSGRSSKGSQ
jgi:hypothetical protein